jgi:hypothetical protein
VRKALENTNLEDLEGDGSIRLKYVQSRQTERMGGAYNWLRIVPNNGL